MGTDQIDHMKNKLDSIKILLIISICFSFLMAFTTVYRDKLTPIPKIPSKSIVNIPITPLEIPQIKIKLSPTEQFLNDLGHRESSNRYHVVNQYGYMGKYQFGSKTLKNLGYNISRKVFLNSPEIQEEAMLKLLKANKHTLRRQIKKYNNRLVNGVYITESGILAAAHLAGPGNVRKWLRNGTEFQDGNGTKITSYLKQFANYNLYL